MTDFLILVDCARFVKPLLAGCGCSSKRGNLREARLDGGPSRVRGAARTLAAGRRLARRGYPGN
jgi:hypothetical protein